MEKRSDETAMVHYQCEVCGMAATMVATPTGALAWQDHMDNHAQKRRYGVWTWTAVQLPLE